MRPVAPAASAAASAAAPAGGSTPAAGSGGGAAAFPAAAAVGPALVAAQPEAPQPPAAPESLDSARRRWITVIERLSVKKASLGSALSGSRLLDLDATGRCRVLVEMAFHRNLMDHVDNKRLIERETTEIFGRRLTIRCITRTEAGIDGQPAPPPTVSSQPAVPKPAVTESPGVRRVIDFFQGRVEAVDS